MSLEQYNNLMSDMLNQTKNKKQTTNKTPKPKTGKAGPRQIKGGTGGKRRKTV